MFGGALDVSSRDDELQHWPMRTVLRKTESVAPESKQDWLHSRRAIAVGAELAVAAAVLALLKES